MPFSIWDYLRERTRDAVVAGFQDALDIVEQNDTEASHRRTASRLSARLAELDTPPVIDAAPLLHASINGHVAANSDAAPTSLPRATAPPPSQGPPAAPTFDDEMESRLSHAAAENGKTTPPGAGLTIRRPRGRPRKSEGSK